jgi:alkylation response protein AidB-like acyl-CoA dehydrogenase
VPNTYTVLINGVAGSDVANIRMTAKRDRDYYIVNGAKKWITNGIWADYCTAAVRTAGPGRKGVSLLVIPLKEKGVTRRRMHNSGVNASGMLIKRTDWVPFSSLTCAKGSTFLEFDNVRVPVSNLIGDENQGFQIIMSSKSQKAPYV